MGTRGGGRLVANAGTGSVVVATSKPSLFETVLAPRLGQSVWLVTSSTEALELLAKVDRPVLVADFTELPDRWTGQRFLRHIKQTKELAHVPVYLMADAWPEHQATWSTRLGAAGLLERSEAAIGAFVLGRSPRLSNKLKRVLGQVDEIFRAHAGPLAVTHLSEARLALESQKIEASAEAYVAFLAERFATRHAREEFERRAAPLVGIEANDAVSSVGDPWLDTVSQLFSQYAGALAARIEVPRALNSLVSHGVVNQSSYLEALANSIVDPGRRAQFLEACRLTGLSDMG